MEPHERVIFTKAHWAYLLEAAVKPYRELRRDLLTGTVAWEQDGLVCVWWPYFAAFRTHFAGNLEVVESGV